jgi:2,3-bisphosphoglycerate-independent phosphoglycerate mutase
MTTQKKAALIILDGWGINLNKKVSAIEAADKKYFDHLIQTNPNSTLITFGEDVGLPEGQMGNSEVGHMNIGAGRVVYQELVRINKAFKNDEVSQMHEWVETVKYATEYSKRIHVMGLLSDGGVHSHINHLLGLCDLLKNDPIDVFLHLFLDGRDTDPQNGERYIKELEKHIKNTNIQIVSVIGRYYAMDRDNRWERTKKAYDLMVHGIGEETDNITGLIRQKYQEGITDEFMTPIKSNQFDQNKQNIQDGDVVIFFNYRTDRPRQLTQVLTQEDNHEYNMHKLTLYMLTFTNYDKTFKNLHVLFEKDNLNQTLGQILSEHGKTQVRIAETEKYPHVTFFFNGGREEPYEGEQRIMIPSPKVPTYDLKPEMSAVEITEALMAHVNKFHPDFICLNYANTDMVGHTGIFEAAVKATETVDECLSKLIPFLQENEYEIIIIADHGNSDFMINEDGSPNTAHSVNPVPMIYVGCKKNVDVSSGKLGDIAPTILNLMDLQVPKVMTGENLIHNK